MFQGLADMIIKRYKIIIGFWIVLFIIATPSLLLINNVIVYQETDVSPLNTGSQASQKVINEEFPSLIPKSSAVIVIRGKNVDDNNMRDFLLSFENKTLQENSTGKLHGVTQVLTLYSVYRDQILKPVIVKIAPLLSEVESNSTNISKLLFDIPTQFYLNYSQLNLVQVQSEFTNATKTVYQGPGIFLMNWGKATGNNSAKGMWAYNQTVNSIAPSEIPYLNTFFDYWNLTWNDSKTYSSDSARAQAAVVQAATKYYGLDHLETMLARERIEALNLMDITDWNDSAKLHVATVTYESDETSYRVWAYLSPQITNTTVEVAENRYLTWFGQNWTASILNGTTTSMTPLQRAEYVKNLMLPRMVDYAISVKPEFKDLKDVLLDGLRVFTLTNWKDTNLLRNFTYDAVSQYAKTLYNITVPRWFLEEVATLGPTPTDAQISALCWHIVETHSVSTLPISLPKWVLGTFIDAKNTTMLAVVGFNGDPANLKIQANVIELRKDLKDQTKSKPEWSGYKTYVTGLAGIDYDLRSSAEADARLIEPFTAVLVIVFIAIFFRSYVAPWVPLAVVGMAYVMAQGAMYLIGLYIGGIHYTIRLVTFTMIMGAGSDYCIFIVSRFREERIQGRKKDDAIKTAIVWAGESIATSGATVMVAFLALATFSFPLVKVMGLCLAVSIGITLLMALTMIPAMLYWIGDYIFYPTIGDRWKKYREAVRSKKKLHQGYFYRAAKISVKHAPAIVLLCLLVSIPTTYLVYTIEPSYDFLGSMSNSEAKRGVDAMSSGFGAGDILPTYVVVQYKSPLYNNNTKTFSSDQINATDGLAKELAKLGSVFDVSSSTYSTLTGLRIDKESYYTVQEMRVALGLHNTTVRLTVVLKSQPFASKAVHAIGDIRKLCKDYKANTPILKDAQVYVGGSTAGTADIGGTVTHDFPISAAIVLLGVYLILLFVIGSVLIPFRLIITILVSISWTLAIALIVFLWWAAIPVLWIMPLLLFVILMGLGMDYDIFLMTRIKEAVMEGKSDEKAIAHAVQTTGSIISICGFIMAGAFGTMMLSSTGMLKEFGFGLCFAILLDATIVRIYLVPAIMVLAKKWNWWAPFGLQKVRKGKSP